MATNNLLSSVLLANGDESAEVTIAESSERVNLRLQSVQQGSASSQARLVCTDADGRVKATVVVDGNGTQEVEVEQIDGALTCQVACNLGNCRVTLDEVTGSEGATGEGPGAVQTADVAAGAVTLPKVGIAGIKTLRFDGRNGSGVITLTGSAVGDRVLSIFGNTTTGGASVVGGTDFEAVISVDDEIQQTLASDLTGNDYVVILIPAAA